VIHPTAIVDSKARLAKDVTVGPFSIIEADVEIESGTKIGSHVLIAEGARIGKNCHIHHGAVLSTLPQDIKFGGEKTTLEIGENTIIREYCTLNRGTTHRGKTTVGKNCFLMAYVHIAHDNIIEDNVIIANSVQLGGHVCVEEWAMIGGLTAVHQFSLIGKHSMIGGGLRVVRDVPPYILTAGEPLRFGGLNIVGLKRRGFSAEAIRGLKQCYRYIYRSNLNLSQAVKKIESEMEITPEVRIVLDFVRRSERGIIR